MSFLTPAFLFGALAAVVPFVLHLVRRERLPRVPFSDLRLLRGARIDPARRRRLREFLLPALRVAALVLLALAFARPFVVARPAPGGPATVLVTHHFEEIPSGFTHALLLKDGRVHAAGPISATLTTAVVSACFGAPIALEHRNGRWQVR